MDKRILPESLQKDIASFEQAVKTNKDLDIWIDELQSSLKALYYGHVINESTFEELWSEYFGSKQ